MSFVRSLRSLMTGLILGILAASTAAFAGSLADDMKQIGGLVKTISGAVSDSSKNSASATEAAQLVTLFGAVLDQVPDSISGLPGDQQPAALADYKGLVQQEIDDAKALENAFLANDNVSAVKILAEMNAIKKDGHGKFAN